MIFTLAAAVDAVLHRKACTDAPHALESDAPKRPLPDTPVERCLKRGFGMEDIAIVSMKGRERSELQRLERLGPWTLRRFTGRYDDGGAAIWTEGQLLIDSIRRFKGQAALAVVLTECDLGDLEALNRCLLFVGLTRARMHLEWVISERTETLLSRSL